MSTTVSNAPIEVIDRKIVGYLARLAGRNPQQFCVPSKDGIRWAAAWAQSDEFIQSRLDHLCNVGRIARATMHGVNGYTVLPDRLWRREHTPRNPNILHLTELDHKFLRACGIAAE